LPGLEIALPAALGVSLAAATGFRVFVPLLMMGLAARAGYLPVSSGFDWVTTAPALLMLAVAAMAEVAAYYVPGLDNLLDTIATPAAVLAGIAVSAAVMTDLPPMLKWTLAIIAGGGAASITQGATTVLRGHSTVLTAGLGNHVIATGEIMGALAISALAIFAPYIALVVAAVFCWIVWRSLKKFRSKEVKTD
jgi:Domain of unknown function (DUF4126)